MVTLRIKFFCGFCRVWGWGCLCIPAISKLGTRSLLDFVQRVDIVVYLPRMLNVYSPMIFEVRPLNLYRDCNYMFASTFKFAIYVILRCLFWVLALVGSHWRETFWEVGKWSKIQTEVRTEYASKLIMIIVWVLMLFDKSNKIVSDQLLYLNVLIYMACYVSFDLYHIFISPFYLSFFFWQQ